MRRYAAFRHALIVFVLANMLAAHGLVTAWSAAISIGPGGFEQAALLCSGGGSNSAHGQSGDNGGFPARHCATACAVISTSGPAPAAEPLTVPILSEIAALIPTRWYESERIILPGLVQARGPPQAA